MSSDVRRPRGRPAKDTALTQAERTRRWRDGKSQVAVCQATLERIRATKIRTGKSTDEVLSAALDALLAE